MELKEGDYIEHLFITTTHHYMLFFTNRGKVYRLKVHQLPRMGGRRRGVTLAQPAAVGRQGRGSRRSSRRRTSRPSTCLFATARASSRSRVPRLHTPLKSDGIIASTSPTTTS
jgi:DNA gyrase subunit A